MTSGIYSITSPSGGQYIGSAVSVSGRWRRHVRSLIAGTHHCRPLLAAAHKYGVENLVFALLVECEREDLLSFEQAAFSAYRPAYNVCKVAGSSLGVKHSAETRAKVSAAGKGRHRSPEACAKTSAALAGRPRSSETRAKLSVAHTGKRLSAEHRAAMSAARVGKVQSPETIARRVATMAAKRSAE